MITSNNITTLSKHFHNVSTLQMIPNNLLPQLINKDSN